MTSHSLARRMAFGAAAIALLAAGCGDDSEATGGVEVDGAWARTSPMVAEAGAAYMQLTAEDATAVVGASVSAEVAARVELHETAPADDMGDMTDDDMTDDDMTDDDMGDTAMTMRAVDEIDLPAGVTVSLEPGGLHMMLMELTEPLELGDEFDLTLSLEDGEELVVTVEARDDAP